MAAKSEKLIIFKISFRLHAFYSDYIVYDRVFVWNFLVEEETVMTDLFTDGKRDNVSLRWGFAFKKHNFFWGLTLHIICFADFAQEVDALFTLGDSNKDGEIDLEEFVGVLYPVVAQALLKFTKGQQK